MTGASSAAGWLGAIDQPFCFALGPDGAVARVGRDGLEKAARGADAEFLETGDPFKVLQLRPLLKAEVPPSYPLQPGELVLCVVLGGAVPVRITVGAGFKGQAAIRRGLDKLRRLDPTLYALLRECLDFTRRAERLTRAPRTAKRPE